MLLSLAGSHLFIGGSRPSGLVLHEPPSLTSDPWVEVAEPEGMGSLGVSWETWHYAPDSDQSEQVITRKGNRAPMLSEIVVGLAPDDPGQAALWAAAKSEDDFAFMITLADGVSHRFWIAAVTSISEAYEAANEVVRLRATLAINSGIQRGAA